MFKMKLFYSKSMFKRFCLLNVKKIMKCPIPYYKKVNKEYLFQKHKCSVQIFFIIKHFISKDSQTILCKMKCRTVLFRIKQEISFNMSHLKIVASLLTYIFQISKVSNVNNKWFVACNEIYTERKNWLEYFCNGNFLWSAVLMDKIHFSKNLLQNFYIKRYFLNQVLVPENLKRRYL